MKLNKSSLGSAQKPLWEKLLPWAIVIMVLLFIGMNSSLSKQGNNNQSQETVAQKQEREKQEALAMEEQKARQARDYCAERNDDTRQYSVMKTEKDSEGRSIDFNINQKTGTTLTEADCRQIIDTLYEWDANRMEEIIQRKYWIDMPRVSLAASVGIPDTVNKSNYGSGEQEQWVFNKDTYGIHNVYIYVNEKEKVTSYQDF